MEFMTILVRWACQPIYSINLPTRGAKNWHMTQWICVDQPADPQYLTLICVHLAKKNVTPYLQQLRIVMSQLWADPPCDALDWEDFNVLLNCFTPVFANTRSVTHTYIRPGHLPSFFAHVLNISNLVELKWNMSPSMCIADEVTSAKMYQDHEAHNVTVLLGNSPTTMLTVACEEPQLMHELMKKYGLTCSTVWDCKTSLSMNSPCKALCEHRMSTVYADVLSHNVRVKEPCSMQFYSNMKYIKVQIGRGALRHRPDNMNTQGATLYYSDNMSTLRNVIKEDGRFNSSAQCIDSEGWVVDAKHMSEFNGDQELTIIGTADDSTSDEDTLKPFTCSLCTQNIVNAYLGCGHLGCWECYEKVRRDGPVICCVCRQPGQYTRLHIPRKHAVTCPMCYKCRTWVSECNHIICKCDTTCPVCDEKVTKLQRVYP